MAADKDVDGMKTRRLLADAASKLRAVLQDEAIAEGTPIETTTAMELALEAIETALVNPKTVAEACRRD